MRSNRSAAERTETLPHTTTAPQPSHMTPIVAFNGYQVTRLVFRYPDQAHGETHYVAADAEPLCGRGGQPDPTDHPGKACLACVSEASRLRYMVK